MTDSDFQSKLTTLDQIDDQYLSGLTQAITGVRSGLDTKSYQPGRYLIDRIQIYRIINAAELLQTVIEVRRENLDVRGYAERMDALAEHRLTRVSDLTQIIREMVEMLRKHAPGTILNRKGEFDDLGARANKMLEPWADSPPVRPESLSDTTVTRAARTCAVEESECLSANCDLNGCQVDRETKIGAMVERFLRWPLPSKFSPDGGISFEPFSNEGTQWEIPNNPTGTNLFSHAQATQMVEHMLANFKAEDIPVEDNTETIEVPLTEFGQAAAEKSGDETANPVASGINAMIMYEKRITELETALKYGLAETNRLESVLSETEDKCLNNLTDLFAQREQISVLLGVLHTIQTLIAVAYTSQFAGPEITTKIFDQITEIIKMVRVRPNDEEPE